jgi:hypothetical protein
MVFPAFLEGSEVLFDGVKVGRVRRQIQQRGAGGLDELRRLRRCVKGRVVHNHEVLGIETRAQPCPEPGVEDHRIARPLKQQWFFELPIHTDRNQRGSWPSLPGDQAVHAVALRCVPIPPRGRRRKPAFIDMDGSFAAAKEPLAQAQEVFPLLRIALLVPDPFFYGSPPVCGVRSRCNAGTPGNAVLAPLVSDRDGLPHDGATRPNPVCVALVGQDACTPRRRA